MKYTDPDGRSTERKGFTWTLLKILLGEDNVNQIWKSPMYDGFARISDELLYAAVQTPCTIVGNVSDYVGLFALGTGNVPLAAAAETFGKVSDAISFTASVMHAYST